jgi:hypothetical protein
MKRPIGVWIIGILALIGAILRILGSLTALGLGSLGMAGKLGETGSDLGGQALAVGIVGLIVGVVILFFALSFLGLRPWAWTALMIMELITIVVAIVQFVFDGFHGATLATVIVPLIIVIYLTRPGVRGAFRR